MRDVIYILFATLAVYGFYSAVRQIREMVRRFGQKKNKCAENAPESFDKER